MYTTAFSSPRGDFIILTTFVSLLLDYEVTVLVPLRGFHYINLGSQDWTVTIFVLVPLRGFHYINLNKYYIDVTNNVLVPLRGFHYINNYDYD